MNKQEQIKWWTKFCNSCSNENCKKCRPPEITKAEDNPFNDMLRGTPFHSFFSDMQDVNVSDPSNYVDMRNEAERRMDSNRFFSLFGW